MDSDTNDIVSGLNDVLTKDGQNIPTQDLPMGGFRHTDVGNAQTRTEYATAAQLQDGALAWGGVSTGSPNAQVIVFNPTIPALVDGQEFGFRAGFTNTGATTLQVSGLPASSLVYNGAALNGGELAAGENYYIAYNATATRFELGRSSGAIPSDLLSGPYPGITQTGVPVGTVTLLTSGTGATYTTPAGCRQLQIYGKGGGGGGGGSGTSGSTPGGTGGVTTFNSVNANGGASGGGSGANGTGGLGGTGGTGTATYRRPGAPGGGSMSLTQGLPGGSGGGSGGGVGTTTTGLNGAANSGGGGSGATAAAGGSVTGGGGGGSGEEFFLIINTPASTYTYTVGAGGTAGGAGTSGSNGAAGGSGVIWVMEFY